MKTLQLIALLDGKEKKELSEKISAKKRPSLTLLFSILAKTKQEPDKTFLYASVFGDTYAEAKDYILRHELRLLNNELESLIVSKETEKQADALSGALALLARMLQTNETGLFLTTYKEAEKQATSQHNYAMLSKLYSLQAEFLIKHKEVSLPNYEAILSCLQKKEEAETNFLQELQAETNFRRAFAIRVVNQLDSEIGKTLNKSSSQPNLENQHIVAEYLNKYAAAYFLSGKEKRRALEELITIHPQIAFIRPSKKSDIASLYGSLGLEYFLANDHEKAHEYYTIALNHTQGEKPYLELYFNYAVNALLLGKHEEVIDLYSREKNAIERNEKLRYRFRYFTAIAYLMLDDAKTAFKMLDQEISKRPVSEYYYYRLVYAMVYFQRKDWDNAEREIENILQSFRFRKSAKKEDQPLLKLLKKMLQAEHIRTQKEKYAKEISKIKTELAEQSQNRSNYSTVVYNWILWQLEK